MRTAIKSRMRAGRAVTIAMACAGAVGVLWLIYLGFTWDLRKADADAAAAFRPVRVVRGDLRETVAGTGTMESVTRVEIKSEVPGVVRRLFVEEGDRVGVGQPLVELDLDRLSDRVAELEAALGVARAAARHDVIGRANADLERVRREHTRVLRLFAQGVSSEQDRDDSVHALALAEIAVRDAEAERDARDAAVLQAQAALQKARRDLEHGVLRSPIDGVVIDRPAELGSPVADMSASNGGTLVAVVADDRDLRLKAQVDENDIARVRVGQAVDVRVDAFPGESFAGAVRKVSSAGTLEQKVANFAVEIALPADERIRVGMSADARIVVGEHRQVLLVPNAAIARTDSGTRVRVASAERADRFRMAAIRELYSDGFQTAVGEGVEEGDTVLLRSDGERP